MHRGLFATVALLVMQITLVSRNFELLSISTGTIVNVCFDKNMVWLHHNTSACDFIGVILHFWCTKQTHFAMTSPRFVPFMVSNATGSSAKLDSLENN